MAFRRKKSRMALGGIAISLVIFGATLMWYRKTANIGFPTTWSARYMKGLRSAVGLNKAISQGEMTRNENNDSVSRPGLRLRNISHTCIPRILYKMAKPGFFEGLPDQFLPDYKSPCFMFKHGNAEILRCLPYFYILGIMKCGTTELWHKLAAHPQVYGKGNISKEVGWWSLSRRRTTPFASYLESRSAKMVQLFDRFEYQKNRLVIGDGSPRTLYDFANWQKFFGARFDGPEFTVADILYLAQPDAKLIITLREPVSRLYSFYLQFYANGSAEEFHLVVVKTIGYYKECLAKMSPRACAYSQPVETETDKGMALHVGLYSVYIRDWLRVFPREQLHIQRLEDWKQDCPKIYSQLLNYLELDSLPDETVRKICTEGIPNSGTWKLKKVGAMLNTTREILLDFYAESNRDLSELLGDERFLWKQ